MSKAEPTAGEWTLDYIYIRAERLRIIGTAHDPNLSGGADEQRANGCLFAASKDLLAACEVALKWATYWDTNEQAKRDAEIIRAAIAKAKGAM